LEQWAGLEAFLTILTISEEKANFTLKLSRKSVYLVKIDPNPGGNLKKGGFATPQSDANRV
jgi:hypothetical protein